MTTINDLYTLVLNMFLLLFGLQTMLAVSMFILIHIIRVERAGVAQRRRIAWVRLLSIMQTVVFVMLVIFVLGQTPSI